MLALSPFLGQRLVGMLSKSSGEDLGTLRDLLEVGKVVPVVEQTFTLKDVPEALRRLGGGHAQGKPVITA